MYQPTNMFLQLPSIRPSLQVHLPLLQLNNRLLVLPQQQLRLRRLGAQGHHPAGLALAPGLHDLCLVAPRHPGQPLPRVRRLRAALPLPRPPPAEPALAHHHDGLLALWQGCRPEPQRLLREALGRLPLVVKLRCRLLRWFGRLYVQRPHGPPPAAIKVVEAQER